MQNGGPIGERGVLSKSKSARNERSKAKGGKTAPQPQIRPGVPKRNGRRKVI